MQLQLQSLPILLSLLFTATANAAAIQARNSAIAAFTLSTSNVCPLPASPLNGQIVSRVNVPYGSACGQCVSISPSGSTPVTYTAINDQDIEPRCDVILFQKSDCSDPGIVTGKGCWTPEGGITAYRVVCPSWPIDDPNTMKACSNPTTPTPGTGNPPACT